MAEDYVIDSSVALKWFLDDEEGVIEARKILTECLIDVARIFVPSHFPSEVGNGLIMAFRRKRVEETRFKKAWKDFLLIPFFCLPWSNALCDVAMDLCLDSGLTFYDAAYVALAKIEKLILVTGDFAVSEAAYKIGLSASYIGKRF